MLQQHGTLKGTEDSATPRQRSRGCQLSSALGLCVVAAPRMSDSAMVQNCDIEAQRHIMQIRFAHGAMSGCADPIASGISPEPR